jgi:5-methylcytosine-specific restriction protein B
VTAICKITLHQTENGEEIQFEKIEQLAKPINYEALQAIPDLAGSEPLVNNQGSLFKLTDRNTRSFAASSMKRIFSESRNRVL